MRLVSDKSAAEVRPGEKRVVEDEKTVISQRPAASPRDFYQQMPLAELADILEGRMLDHFAVGQLIGGGGMGAVFRGLDKRLDRVVAIKVIPAAKRDPAMLRRFRLEAQAAARLDHPNIARVFYVGEAEQWDYIVFEFIDGINVRDLVELEGPLSVDDAVFYTRQIAEALQHAHERDVVHRDIKPSNILVTAAGTAKLVDMGLARDTSLERSPQDHTASGITLGTFDYISPEQARNPRDADVRSDMYSLGCSLFFMLTGHPPFPEGTALQKLLNHGSLPPPDPRGWRDDLPDELCQILTKLMAKRPVDRYQKPIELVNDLLLLAELDGLKRSQGPTTFAILPTLAQPTLLETHLPWLIAAGVLLGSTLWLQSQTLSSGFALPSVEYPVKNPSLGELPVPGSSAVMQQDGLQTVDASRVGLGQASVAQRTTAGTESQANLNDLPLPPDNSSALDSRTPRSQLPSSTTSVDSSASTTGLPLHAADNGRVPHKDLALVAGPEGQVLPEPTFVLPRDVAPTVSDPASSGTRSVAASRENAAMELSPTLGARSSNREDWLNLQSPLTNAMISRWNSPAANFGPESVAEAGLESQLRPSAERSTVNSAVPSVPANGTTVAPTVLVVSSMPPTGVSGEYWESSLYRAVQRLADQPGPNVIEVRGSVWLDRPLMIGSRRTDHSAPVGSLVIRGGQGSNARIEVARGVWGNVASGAGVIAVHDSHIILQGIQVQAVLNDTKTVPRTIFQMTGRSMLEAKDCVFTVQCDRSDTTHLVSMGEKEGSQSALVSNTERASKASRITMEHCFVRGQTSLFKIAQADAAERDSVQISISDSLIAIEGQAVNLYSGTGQGGVERIVRFFCQWSTFVCTGGFARMEYTGAALPRMGLSRTSQACAFWSRPQTPHVSISGQSVGLPENPDLLFLQGANNAYDQQTQTLCQTVQGTYAPQEFDFREGQREGWFVERGNERALAWVQPFSWSDGLHKASIAEFALDPTHFVPGFRGSQHLSSGQPPSGD